MPERFNSIESMRALYEISRLICSSDRREDRFLKALELVQNTVGCHSASLFIYDEDEEKLKETATVGSRVDLIESTEFEMGTGLSAWVAKQRKAILLPDVRKNSPDGFKSFISSPLVSEESLIGVLNVGHHEPNYFSEHHLKFIEIIAAQLAITIERARFENKLLEQNAALEEAQHEIRKQQEHIIEIEKNQMLAQISVSLNHEINNPLTSILGNAELILLKQPDLDGEIIKKITIILNEGRRIVRIISKFRDIKQIVVKDYLDSGTTMIDIDASHGFSDTGNTFPGQEESTP